MTDIQADETVKPASVRRLLTRGAAWVASALFATAGLAPTAGQTVLYGDGNFYLLTLFPHFSGTI